MRAHYSLVSCDLVFSGARPSGECWDEEDLAKPTTALGRSLLAREELVQRFRGSWSITRPADVYGVNLAIPGGGGERRGAEPRRGRARARGTCGSAPGSHCTG